MQNTYKNIIYGGLWKLMVKKDFSQVHMEVSIVMGVPP